jgi:RimJ/RimL family protein N-acetyltransferase
MFHLEDLDYLAALLADKDVMRYVENGVPISRQKSEEALYSIIRHWENHNFGRWAIVDKGSGEFIGFGGLRSLLGLPEVVYHLAPSHWGKGLATEVARASLRFGFTDRHLERIVAVAKPENAASVHVMEKVGMSYEKHTSYYNFEVIQYSLARQDFQVDDSPYLLLP